MSLDCDYGKVKKDIIKRKRRYETRSSETSNISTFEGKIYLNS